jgi:hypothetical protein
MNEVDLTEYPTLFAGMPLPGYSTERYTFIPTIRVIESFVREGWIVRSVVEARVNEVAKTGFQKHMVRFTTIPGEIKEVGDVSPEIVLTNSHDGGTSFRLDLGLFRKVCTNGLVVSDGLFASHRVKHQGYASFWVDRAIEDVIKTLPVLQMRLTKFRETKLSMVEAEEYAKRAIGLRWESGDQIPAVSGLLQPARQEDAAPTLWNVFNRIQERFVQGDRGLRIRRISSISKDLNINKELWEMTEEFAEEVAAR